MKLPTLNGEKIYLRPITESDVGPRYVAWLNDKEVNQFLETRFSEQTLESILTFVQSKIGSSDEFLFAICLKDSDLHIGNIKLGPVNPNHKHSDVSLFLGDKSQWGKGFAREAISLITNWAFQELKLEKLKAGCYEPNEGSAKAFEKNGYRREGFLADYVEFDGRRMGVTLLGISKKEFNEHRR
jgi:ribosomal-protein-alanine N-acetyltransferase